MIDLTRPLGPLLVLDIESAPNPRSVAIAGRGNQIARPALHRLVAASTLGVTEDADGQWKSMELASVADAREEPMLADLSVRIESLAADGGTLVTYNGIRHDVPVLRQRAQANWAFALAGIVDLNKICHLDLSHLGPRVNRTPPALRDACAGLGITIGHLAIPHERNPLAAPIRKSQCDVCGTLLLLLHELALSRQSPKSLMAGWRALSTHLAQADLQGPHLQQFRVPM